MNKCRRVSISPFVLFFCANASYAEGILRPLLRLSPFFSRIAAEANAIGHTTRGGGEIGQCARLTKTVWFCDNCELSSVTHDTR